jgi:hypothetical protein
VPPLIQSNSIRSWAVNVKRVIVEKMVVTYHLISLRYQKLLLRAILNFKFCWYWVAAKSKLQEEMDRELGSGSRMDL